MDDEQTRIAFDNQVRYHVYDNTMREGRPPTMAETSAALGHAPDEVQASFERLATGHIVVLQQGTGEILMANPFSAVPTPFLVRVGARAYFGNCIWDALGIAAMLKQDAAIEASCGCCGTAMSVKIKDGMLAEGAGLAHFAIPAAHWWDDIVFN